MGRRNGARVRANLVVSADGATTLGGSSSSLSSAEDRKRFHQIRKSADLIIIGGNTAANEPYASTPCDLWVLSTRPLPASVQANSRASVKKASIQQAIAEATDAGYREILIEAGPSLLHEATRLQLVDELLLTVVKLPQGSGENKVDIHQLTDGYIEIERSESQVPEAEESYIAFRPIKSNRVI